jgi:hypothetical protein
MLNIFTSSRIIFICILSILFFIPGCGGGGGDSGGGGDVADTTPPAVPTGLTATAKSASRIDLAWSASTDAVGYYIYRDGTRLHNVYGATTIQDLNLTAKTTYNYRVSAYDSAGNESGQSTLASATTSDTATQLLGTTGNDYGRGIAIDPSGNMYVTGWTPGNLDGQTGGPDIFLTKYNASGVRQWTRLLGTTGVTEPVAGDFGGLGQNVAVDSTGSAIYVTGYTTASMDLQTYRDGKDIFLVKYDPTGNKLWTRMYGTAIGSAADDVATGVVVDSRGYIFITGWTTGDLDGAFPGPFGQEDMFLAMYYDTGNRSWLIQRGTAETDIATGIAVDNSGQNYWVYLTGATKGNLDSARTTSTGNYDIFLVQYDLSTASTPTWTWTKMLGTASDDAALAINARNANVHIAGVTGGSLDGHTSAGGNDIFVAAYDHAGVKLWTTQLGTSADDIAYGITVDSIGNSYIAGFTSGNPSPFKPNAGLEDIFMIKFGIGGGTPFAVSLAGTTVGDEGRAIAILESSNALYVVGSTAGNLDGETNAGGYDMCLLKFNLAGEQQ